ncbi:MULTISPECIES: glutathione S-transferase N-terminal domain-containing protein [Halomonadaceae]|uniref:Glutathione S-transferase n=1 Tax=Onishia taeanensis TaxID=284577 RepID=A0A328XTC1_9GAMM|nr:MULTISPECIES: glutathione S-transferase N-terminal domain-containing protein [Halomonas]RAR62950.1 glutathione S-transferase [Halomonas taeanensis]
MMTLLYSPTSPYARTVRVVVAERGLENRITFSRVDPWSTDPALLTANPLSRVPALVTDDGQTLTESLLIARYLEGIAEAPTTSRVPEPRQAEVLALAGLGQGLMDAAFHTVMLHKFHSDSTNTESLVQRRHDAVLRTIDSLESQVTSLSSEQPTLGDIVIAVALDYLAFRLPEIAWHQAHPQLASWLERILARESFSATRPTNA